jgi:hypothetical protein
MAGNATKISNLLSTRFHGSSPIGYNSNTTALNVSLFFPTAYGATLSSIIYSTRFINGDFVPTAYGATVIVSGIWVRTY